MEPSGEWVEIQVPVSLARMGLETGLGVTSKDLVMEAGHQKAWGRTIFQGWLEGQEPAKHRGKTGEGDRGKRELKQTLQMP